MEYSFTIQIALNEMETPSSYMYSCNTSVIYLTLCFGFKDTYGSTSVLPLGGTACELCQESPVLTYVGNA